MKRRRAHNDSAYVLAVDIETSGPYLTKNALLSVGCSVQDSNGKEHESFLVNIKPPEGRIFDPECKKQFWDRHPQAMEAVQKDAQEPHLAVAKLKSFLDKVNSSYKDCVIVSDNPSFDIAWIDQYLSEYGNSKPMRYGVDGTYRMVWDTSSVQKFWMCIKTTSNPNFYFPPRKHREKLGLKVDFEHNHTALNDARTIAGYYAQTVKQMQDYIASALAPKSVFRIIKVVPYDEQWAVQFETEKQAIKRVLDGAIVDIHHIGSTSVPGLPAKPIIDIALVLNQTNIESNLASVGYKYKGEYNIPMRHLFGKKGDYAVYLHAYQEDNAEVDAALAFRDALRQNCAKRDDYATLKRKILEEDSLFATVGSGISTYNLKKADFIHQVLSESGYRGLCMRLCTADKEWEVYEKIKNCSGETKKSDPSYKHLVLYEGVEIVAAGQVNFSTPNAFISFIKDKDASSTGGYCKHMLNTLIKWAADDHIEFITAKVGQEDLSFYRKNGFHTIKECAGDGEDVVRVLHTHYSNDQCCH